MRSYCFAVLDSADSQCERDKQETITFNTHPFNLKNIFQHSPIQPEKYFSVIRATCSKTLSVSIDMRGVEKKGGGRYNDEVAS